MQVLLWSFPYITTELASHSMYIGKLWHVLCIHHCISYLYWNGHQCGARGPSSSSGVLSAANGWRASIVTGVSKIVVLAVFGCSHHVIVAPEDSSKKPITHSSAASGTCTWMSQYKLWLLLSNLRWVKTFEATNVGVRQHVLWYQGSWRCIADHEAKIQG